MQIPTDLGPIQLVTVEEKERQGYQSSIGLTQDKIKRLLSYDEITGVFRWKVSLSPKAPVGQIAGSEYVNGYIFICIGGTRHGAHALAWLYVHGELTLVDHKNRIRNDNAIANLRPATYSKNNHNKYSYNPLGRRGVRFRSGKYEANIRINGIVTRLGFYATLEEAAKAYEEAARTYFGEFAYAATEES